MTGAAGAHMEDARAERLEHRPDTVEGSLGATGHDRQGSLLRRRRTARDPRVDEFDAALVRELEVRTPTAAGCIEAFELAAELGYGEQISNRVVDAIGDVSGGVRLQDDPELSN